MISGVGYKYLRENIIKNYQKDVQILFYEVQNKTNFLLSKLLFQYTTQEKLLLSKHKEVLNYLHIATTPPLKTNLDKIYKKINQNTTEGRYNIYITDKNFVIKNATYKKDIGFNLSFAKKSFDKHFIKHTVGVCTPLFEKSSKQFLSYTDSYIDKSKNNLLQISYTYEETNEQLADIRELILKYPDIIDAKAYIIVDTGFVNDIILKDFKPYKPTLREILKKIQNGKKINSKLINTKLIIKNFTDRQDHYIQMSLSTKSAIFDNTKIIYSIILRNNNLHMMLNQLNIAMAFTTLLGIIAILLTSKTRKKEIKLTQQDSFIQHSMHEIKTPLSIITLNNELRELKFGDDEYSQEIQSAIKILTNSYEDMNYIMTQDKVEYQLLVLDIQIILQERISYFKNIAQSYSKSFSLEVDGRCKTSISKIELIRLIDNNLSNAIKYSNKNSVIFVKLNKNILSFHNDGEPISHKQNIFKKYYRENKVVGGHGLGLSIVKNIADKYIIDIEVKSSVKMGNTFIYKFKCHMNDISKE